MDISEVGICNLGLGWLGQTYITSLTDVSNEAQLCKLNYPIARDSVLEEGAWSFATKWQELAQLAETPIFGSGKLYALPTAALRVFQVDDGGETFRNHWTLYGRKIQADISKCYALMVFQITDPTLFTPKFVEAVATRLAANIAMPITNSAKMHETMVTVYQQKVRDALNSDNLQGRQIPIRSDGLITVR